MLNGRGIKGFLLMAGLLLLTSGLCVAQDADRRREGHKVGGRCVGWGAPDGGSTVGYLVGIGAASLGAMLVRSRQKARLT